MILTCPSCFARYLTSADAIGERGRDVRCGKCGHMWHQEPVRDSLDELDQMVAAMTESGDDAAAANRDKYKNIIADFVNSEEEVVLPAPEDITPQAPIPVAPLTHKGKEKEPPLFLKLALAKRAELGGASGGLAAFLILALCITFARVPLSHAMPFLEPTFVALGLQARLDEKVMVFDSVTARLEHNKLSISGSLINLSSDMIPVPPMVIEVIDGNTNVLKSFVASLETTKIKGEETIQFNFAYENIPQDARNARIRLSSSENVEDAVADKTSTTDEEAADNTHAQSGGETDHPPAHE